MPMAKPILAAALAAAALTLSSTLPAQEAQEESRSAGQYIDDKTTSARVKSALVESPAAGANEVQVETYRGVVQLSGFVDSPQEADAAASAASRVPGVRAVINSVQIKPDWE